MAKRKHKSAHHRTHRRRRHHSGMNGISMNTLMPTLIQVGEGAAGAIAASFLLGDKSPLANFMADKPSMKPLLLMGAGVTLALTMKNPHIKAVALGVATFSSVQLAKHAIPGIGDLMIGDLDGMMENLMIGKITEPMMIGGGEEMPATIVIHDQVMEGNEFE